MNIYDAWNSSGSHPSYHDRMKAYLRITWPDLAKALDDLEIVGYVTVAENAEWTREFVNYRLQDVPEGHYALIPVEEIP